MQTSSRVTADSKQSAAKPAVPQPKLFDQVRPAIHAGRYSKRFIFSHAKCHPSAMAEAEINLFLTGLALNEGVSASAQNRALSALLFSPQQVLKKALAWINPTVQAKKHPVYIPTLIKGGRGGAQPGRSVMRSRRVLIIRMG